jgi:catechol 2,3-dioxygenase-like lactoylglutathione lyase family enzyme
MPSFLTKAFKETPFALTLFTRDLEESRSFYEKALGLKSIFDDEVSVIFSCGDTVINLLAETEAPVLLSPAELAPSTAGVRAVYTLRYSDIDGAAAELKAAGVTILNGPIDRPWGVRTVSFQDPSGHTWELANHD